MNLRSKLSIVTIFLVATFLVASLIPAQAAITFGRWRDISPTDYSSDVTGTVRGIYVRNGGTGAIGAGDGWAVGGDAATPLISHYDGFSWQILASPVAGAVYNSAHFCTNPGAPSVGLCSPNGDGSDGWIVGGAAGMVGVYWDGSGLTQVSTGLGGAGTLNSVFMVCHSPPFGTGCPSGAGFSSGLTYAVGTDTAQGVIYAFNGNPKSGGGWTLQFTSALTGAGGFSGVYMYVDQAGALAGFAVGAGGVIARLTGGAWVEAVAAAGVTFNGVFVDRRDPADAWAVGNALAGNAQIWHCCVAPLTWGGPVSPGSTANDLVGVFLTSTSEGWIVGRSGTILHSTTLGGANAWLALNAPLQTAVGAGINLLGVSFPGGSNGWAAGSAGVILHTENSGCPGVPSPCWGGSSSITQSTQLNAVFMKGSNDGWAGGLFDLVSGIHSLIHWDGNKWHRASVSPVSVISPNIWGIYMLSSSEAWAVGGNTGNTVPEALKWDGGSWTGQPVALCACSLRSVYMISGGTGGDGWAVGTGGQILRYQGGSWTLHTTVPGVPQLNSVFISNPGSNLNAGWAVGNGGTVVKLAIVAGVPTWSVVGIPGIVAQNLYSVYFKDSNHGWIVGDSATIVSTTDGGTSWSGGTGQVTGAPITSVLRSVFVDTFGTGSGNGDGWAVGDDGTGPPAKVVFAHWDGLTWTNTPLAPPPAVATGLGLHSVYLMNPEDGFAVGEPITGGTLSGIIHLDPPSPPTTQVTLTVTTSTPTTTSSSTSSSTSTSTSTVAVTTSTSSSETSTVETSSSLVTSTTESSTSSETSSSSSVATVTVTQSSSTTTPLVMPAIPGFPVESILAGIVVGLTALTIMRRRRR